MNLLSLLNSCECHRAKEGGRMLKRIMVKMYTFCLGKYNKKEMSRWMNEVVWKSEWKSSRLKRLGKVKYMWNCILSLNNPIFFFIKHIKGTRLIVQVAAYLQVCIFTPDCWSMVGWNWKDGARYCVRPRYILLWLDTD